MTDHPIIGALAGRAKRLVTAEMGGATIIVSPHPDDECLGCGGLILQLRDAGLPVTIVQMTNGNRSHAHLEEPSRLAARRTAEALAAAAALGVARDNVHLLGFDDGTLAANFEPAADMLAAIFDRVRPAQIFVPYRAELPSDHSAARASARYALQTLGRPVRVFEYPVWFWNHWPLCRRAPSSSRLRHMVHGMRAEISLFRDFRHVIDIGRVLDRKRAALACHRSQIQRQVPDPAWRVLADVADGRWLNLFFTGVEFFHWTKDLPCTASVSPS